MRYLKPFATLTIVCCFIGIAFVVGKTIGSDSPHVDLQEKQTAPVQLTASQLLENSADAEAQPGIRKLPEPSGNRYHALDLINQRPFPDQGQMVTLDVVSTPHMDGYGGLIAYTALRMPIPVEAHAHGVSLDRCLDDTLCIFEVVEQVPGGGVEIPQAAGAIAVEISDKSLVPSEAKVWDVEPDGTQEVTLKNGEVLRLPKVRFWRYHES